MTGRTRRGRAFPRPRRLDGFARRVSRVVAGRAEVFLAREAGAGTSVFRPESHGVALLAGDLGASERIGVGRARLPAARGVPAIVPVSLGVHRVGRIVLGMAVAAVAAAVRVGIVRPVAVLAKPVVTPQACRVDVRLGRPFADLGQVAGRMTTGPALRAALAVLGRVHVGEIGGMRGVQAFVPVARVAGSAGVARLPVVGDGLCRGRVVVAVLADVIGHERLGGCRERVLVDKAGAVGIHVMAAPTGDPERRVVRGRATRLRGVQLVVLGVGERGVAVRRMAGAFDVGTAGGRDRGMRLDLEVVTARLAFGRRPGARSGLVRVQGVQLVALVTPRAALAAARPALRVHRVGDLGVVHDRGRPERVAILAAALLPVVEYLGHPSRANVVVALATSDVLAIRTSLDDRHRRMRFAQVTGMARFTRGDGLSALGGADLGIHHSTHGGVRRLSVVSARIRVGQPHRVRDAFLAAVVAEGAFSILRVAVTGDASDALVLMAARALGVGVVLVEVGVGALGAVATLAGVRAPALLVLVVVAGLGEGVHLVGGRVPAHRERSRHDGGQREHGDARPWPR